MAKKGLGRGLGALLGTSEDAPSNDTMEVEHSEKSQKRDTKPSSGDSKSGITSVKLNLIEPNRKQPRKNFDDEKIAALSESIKKHGLIQPIIITEGQNGMYRIIAGERRWRAAKLAGLYEIPAIIRGYTEKEAAEIALIENLQREDLNPIEEAMGYRSLIDEFGMTQEDISRRIGKSRSAVANSLRLLALGEDISALLISGKLTTGHARALLSLDDPSMRSEAAGIIIEQGLNVRQTEALVKKLLRGDIKKPEKQVNEEYEIQLEHITSRLSDTLGTKVSISHNDKKGRIEIEYYGDDDLERILHLLNY